MPDRPRVSIIKSELPVTQNDIGVMVKEAIDLVGGIGQFVKSGDTVVIKPNIFAPYPPPITVDRRVIGALVSLLKEVGAKRVVVIEGASVGSYMMRINIENTKNSDTMKRGMKTLNVMELLGVRDAVENAGGEVLGVEDAETNPVMVPNGKVLHFVDYPEPILNADCFINLPAMKTHTMTLVTLGIKNLQGILNQGDRYHGHRDDLDQHMVDIMKIRKPDLTLVDGLIGMEGMGAGEGGSPIPMGVIMAGADPVAVDSVGSQVMGIDAPTMVGTTRIAAYDGIGIADPSKIEVLGGNIDAVKKKFLLPVNFTQPIDTLVTGVYPNVDVFIGGACSTCWLMAAIILTKLSKITEGASLIVGVDPKVPPKKDWDLNNTFILGDCALGCAGEVREIRNRMALSEIDNFLPGCPPYEQALLKVESLLVKRGIISEDELIEKAKEHRKKFFDYYREFDPTWEPLY